MRRQDGMKDEARAAGVEAGCQALPVHHPAGVKLPGIWRAGRCCWRAMMPTAGARIAV